MHVNVYSNTLDIYMYISSRRKLSLYTVRIRLHPQAPLIVASIVLITGYVFANTLYRACITGRHI